MARDSRELLSPKPYRRAQLELEAVAGLVVASGHPTARKKRRGMDVAGERAPRAGADAYTGGIRLEEPCNALTRSCSPTGS